MKRPVRFWKKNVLHDIMTTSVLEKNVLHDIMTTCIILHNMIIEDEREFATPTELGREAPPPDTEIAEDENLFQNFFVRFRNIKDKKTYVSLRNALVDHL